MKFLKVSMHRTGIPNIRSVSVLATGEGRYGRCNQKGSECRGLPFLLCPKWEKPTLVVSQGMTGCWLPAEVTIGHALHYHGVVL